MNTILKFPVERVRRKTYGISDTSHNAAILVFEGVQYKKNEQPEDCQRHKKVSTNRKTRKS